MSESHSLLLPMRGSLGNAMPVELSSITQHSVNIDRNHSFSVHVPSSTAAPSAAESAAPAATAAAVVAAADAISGGAHMAAWRSLHLSRAKLKASSRTSALLSGFAMVARRSTHSLTLTSSVLSLILSAVEAALQCCVCVQIAMVEVQLSTKIPSGLLVAFAVCTTLLVSIHMLALMISTCILPHLEAAAAGMHAPAAVSTSPHRRMHVYIETAWVFSTVAGLMLFMVEIGLLCWVQFFSVSREAAWAATAMLVPVAVVFTAFAVHFYRQLVTHRYQLAEDGLRELEQLKGQLDMSPADQRHHSAYSGAERSLMQSTFSGNIV